MWNEDARMTLYSNKCMTVCVCVCVWTYLSVSVCECVRGKASRGRVLSGFGTPTTICNGAVTMTLCVCVCLYWICVCVCVSALGASQWRRDSSRRSAWRLPWNWQQFTHLPSPSHTLPPCPTRATHFSCLFIFSILCFVCHFYLTPKSVRIPSQQGVPFVAIH